MLDKLNEEILQELWIPEDVYASIRFGQSVLWMGEEGFVVTQIRQDQYTGAKQLYIWLAHSYDYAKDVVSDDYYQLEVYAKQNGCELVQFSSTRMGWLRRGKELGFVRGPVTFTKRIQL